MSVRLAPVLLLAALVSLSAFADITRGHLIPGAWEHPDVVDLDGDGLSDLVQGDHVLLATGGGNFVKRSLGLEAGDYVVDVLDVNGDGRVDLLTTYNVTNRPTPAPQKYDVYIATGNLTWAPKVRLPIRNYGKPYIADVNDDGKDDLVQHTNVDDARGMPVASEWTVMISRGDGTFAARAPFRLDRNPQFGLYNFNLRLPAADFDGDGHTDLVFRFATQLVVMHGTGTGDFASPKTRFLPRAIGSVNVIGDINRDGNPDLVYAGDRFVHVFLNDGRGNFPRATSLHLRKLRNVSIPSWVPQGTVGYSTEFKMPPRRLGLGEFVKQGRTEILTATGEGDVVVLALEDGKLREVARLQTEYLEAGTAVGAFRTPGQTDALLTWHLSYPEARPRPMLVYGNAAVADAVARPVSRNRAVRAPWSPAIATIEVEIEGLCVAPYTERWTFEREGYFAVQRRDLGASAEAPVVEAMFAGDDIHLMFQPSWARGPIEATLTRNKKGLYEGVAAVSTADCLGSRVKLVATKN